MMRIRDLKICLLNFQAATEEKEIEEQENLKIRPKNNITP